MAIAFFQPKQDLNSVFLPNCSLVKVFVG